jgi:phosphopantothenoylcysteine decarboxylase/phosphopantothenate--cysteine ligase
MDMDMLNHPAVKKNLEILSSYGNHVLDSPEGELASGLSGKGRMADPEEIINELKDFFKKKSLLQEGAS